MKRKIKKFNCSPKLDKPVIIPTRNDILPILEEVRNNIVNCCVPIDEFVQELGVFIGKRFNITVKHVCSPEVDEQDVGFSSFYDGGLDENNEVPIEIYIVTNPANEVMIMDTETFDRMIRTISDNLAHEMIHMYQYRTRDFWEPGPIYVPDDCSEEEENLIYLSDPDEIGAYAHNIACELLEHGDVDVVKEKLKEVKKITIKESVNLWAYVQTFQEYPDHPVMRKLLKKVYQNISK
jgi:hypothetical protein